MGTKTKKAQRGSELPLGRVKVEDLAKLSDEQLIAVANGSHQQFMGTMRKAIVVHARLAGAALEEIKARLTRQKDREVPSKGV